MKELVLNERAVMIIIPQCCRENWDTCTHVAKKHRRQKKNVGL